MPKSTFRVITHLVALPDKVQELKAVLTALITPTRQEKGCIKYELLQNRADPTDLTLVSEWETDIDFDNHLVSTHIQTGISNYQGLVSSDPDIRRYNLIA